MIFVTFLGYPNHDRNGVFDFQIGPLDQKISHNQVCTINMHCV